VVKQFSLVGFEFTDSADSCEKFVELTNPIDRPFGGVDIV
jgi:hypothetical protein